MAIDTTTESVLFASSTLGFNVGWFGWLVIGGLAGWIASKFMGTDKQQGIFLNIIVGVIGGWLGGFALRALDIQTGAFGWILTFITALVGACVLLFVVKLVTGRR